MADDESKFKEPIWSINPKWRGWFYGVLSVCGVAVSGFTLYDEWSKGWLEIFDEIRNGIVNSVVVVWFVFQVMESVMGAYQYFMGLKEARRLEAEARVKEAEARVKAAKEKVRQEAAEKARQEERDSLRKYIETVRRKKTFSAEDMLRFLEDLGKDPKD